MLISLLVNVSYYFQFLNRDRLHWHWDFLCFEDFICAVITGRRASKLQQKISPLTFQTWNWQPKSPTSANSITRIFLCWPFEPSNHFHDCKRHPLIPMVEVKTKELFFNRNKNESCFYSLNEFLILDGLI